jgi:hypothetical protein
VLSRLTSWLPGRLTQDENQGMEELLFEDSVTDIAIRLSLIPTFKLNNMRKLLEELEEQTVKTKWITAEIDKITALIYFMVTISVFIVAIVVLPSILHKFAVEFADTFMVRLGVVIFSAFALSAVIVMLILRIRGLLNKASTVFSYLTALGAIKVEKDKFKGTLEEIEGYLNGGDWTLAKYWIERIQKEYTESFLSEVSKLSSDHVHYEGQHY